MIAVRAPTGREAPRDGGARCRPAAGVSEPLGRRAWQGSGAGATAAAGAHGGGEARVGLGGQRGAGEGGESRGRRHTRTHHCRAAAAGVWHGVWPLARIPPLPRVAMLPPPLSSALTRSCRPGRLSCGASRPAPRRRRRERRRWPGTLIPSGRSACTYGKASRRRARSWKSAAAARPRSCPTPSSRRRRRRRRRAQRTRNRSGAWSARLRLRWPISGCDAIPPLVPSVGVAPHRLPPHSPASSSSTPP